MLLSLLFSLLYFLLDIDLSQAVKPKKIWKSCGYALVGYGCAGKYCKYLGGCGKVGGSIYYCINPDCPYFGPPGKSGTCYPYHICNTYYRFTANPEKSPLSFTV